MKNLRQYAKGKPCQIRLPGCTGNIEETVLCHYRDSSTGMGRKEADLIGAWGCSSCHDVVDGRKAIPLSVVEIELGFLQGIVRTQRKLIENEVIS